MVQYKRVTGQFLKHSRNISHGGVNKCNLSRTINSETIVDETKKRDSLSKNKKNDSADV